MEENESQLQLMITFLTLCLRFKKNHYFYLIKLKLNYECKF